MSISPIGLHNEIHPRADTAEAAEHPRRAAPRPAISRTVTVDLPDPMPGRLQLDVDRETGRVIGRIIDKESGRLIRQVPSDEALRLAASVEGLVEPLHEESA